MEDCAPKDEYFRIFCSIQPSFQCLLVICLHIIYCLLVLHGLCLCGSHDSFNAGYFFAPHPEGVPGAVGPGDTTDTACYTGWHFGPYSSSNGGLDFFKNFPCPGSVPLHKTNGDRVLQEYNTIVHIRFNGAYASNQNHHIPGSPTHLDRASVHVYPVGAIKHN